MKIQYQLIVYNDNKEFIYIDSFFTMRSLLEKYKLVRKRSDCFYFRLSIMRAQPAKPKFGVSLSPITGSAECYSIFHRVSCWSIIRLKDKVKSILNLLSYE